MRKFTLNLLSTVVAAALSTLLFFLVKEYLFPSVDVTGKWHLRTETTSTAYGPYQKLVLGYIAIIWVHGETIEGSIEKVYEHSPALFHDNERYITGKDRTRGYIRGKYEKKFIKQDTIKIHTIEEGENREISVLYDLFIDNETTLKGTFISTAADSAGITAWQREPF